MTALLLPQDAPCDGEGHHCVGVFATIGTTHPGWKQSIVLSSVLVFVLLFVCSLV